MRYKNNPFNIRANENTIKFKGYVGTDNGFLTFSDIYYGIRACIILLHTYSTRHIVEIRDIINTFAPPFENPTSSYISFVCDRMHVTRSYVVSVYEPIMLFKLLQAMAAFESNYHLDEIAFDIAYHKFIDFKNNSLSIFDV